MAFDVWQEAAYCRDADTDLFFPEQGYGHGRALGYCIACPVQAACLNDAMADRERPGIQGALGPRQRRNLRYENRLPEAPKGTYWEWNEELQGWQLAWRDGHTRA